METAEKTGRAEEWELIGEAPVDSGQIMVIDPCYVLDGEAYESVCKVTLSEKGCGPVSDGGTVVGTAYGDGVYPVFGRRDDQGRIVELRVDLEPWS